MLRRLLIAVCPTTLAVLAGVHARGLERGRPSYCPRDVYVVSVGVNRYTTGNLVFAESDARRFAARVQRDTLDSIPAPGTSDRCHIHGVVPIVLTGTVATRAAVAHAMATVIKTARDDDALLFYFAGKSTTLRDGHGRPETFLCTADAPGCVPDSIGAVSAASETLSRSVPARQLKLWLEATKARHQLLVLDAGPTRTFFPEFISTIVDTAAVSAGLTGPDRVIVVPETFGIDASELKAGYLTYLLTSFPGELSVAPFGPATRRLLEGHLVREQFAHPIAIPGVADNDHAYARVFSEREFLETYSYLQATDAGAMRGFGNTTIAASAPADASAPKSIALVVGTSTYGAGSGWQHLPNPAPDAKALATELADHYGFDVSLLTDPTKVQIQRALGSLSKRTYGPNDEVLIFFAGHGLYDDVQGTGVLVPADAESRKQDEYLNSYFTYGDLERWVNGLKAKHVLLILDACFSGTFAGSLHDATGRGDPMYDDVPPAELIRRKLAVSPSRIYLTSGGKEYVPDGRPGHHSPFTARLLSVLRKADAPGQVISLVQFRDALDGLSPEPRVGMFGDGDDGGDFVFVSRRASATSGKSNR